MARGAFYKMSIYAGYILLGFSLAAPIGPVNAAQLDKGIKYGFLNSWLVGLGAMVADAIFMLLIYFGAVHILDIPFVKSFLWCFGCIVLVYSGLESIRGAGNILSENRTTEESPTKSFYQGFFMTFSNPVSILFWLGIYGSILAQTAETYGKWDLLLYSSGIFVGLLLWDVTMASTATLFHKFIGKGLLVLISRLAGVALIGFGIYFGIQAARMMFG
jgi:L-lysine exporter family protein LysE/ArgO